MRSTMFGGLTGESELKDDWDIAKMRCPKILQLKANTLKFYEMYTRHHANVFQAVNLPKDIDCVWSFFSGYSPEFLALEQHITRAFTYTAIDNNNHDIDTAQSELNGISERAKTNFLCKDLNDWLRERVQID